MATFEQLKDIMQTSWNRTKEKIKEITDDYVSKTNSNTIIGETILTNGYVAGESAITKSHNEARATMVSLGIETGYYGIPSLSIEPRTYIDKIICIMHDSSGEVGEIASGVNIGGVSKGTGKLLEYIKRGETAEIVSNPISSGTNSLTGSKAISIPINKSWNEEVYFIVGAKGMMVGYENSNTPSIGGNDLVEVGHVFGDARVNNYVGRVAIYTSKQSLNEVAKKALNFESEITALKNDYVSKTEDNIIIGETSFKNITNFRTLLLDGGRKEIINPVGSTSEDKFGGDRYTSFRSLTTAKFLDGYIENIRIYIAADVEVENVTGVHIWAVTKGTNLSDDRIIEKIPEGDLGNQYPLQTNGSIKFIDIPIQKSYNSETYFIIGGVEDHGNNTNGRRFVSINFTGNNDSDFSNIVNTNQRPNIGSAPNNQSGSGTEHNYCAKMELFGKVDIDDVISNNSGNSLTDAQVEEIKGLFTFN